MKSILFVFCGLLLITSCSSVRFGSPQPNENRELKKMPSNLIGNYVDMDGDTLFVKKKSFIFKHDDEKKLSGERVVLKKFNNFYVLSCKEILHGSKTSNLNGWDVILVKMSETGVLLCYSINTSTDEKEQAAVNKLKEILFIEKLSNGREEDYYVINPNKQEFEEILESDIFSVVMEFKRIVN